VEGQSFLYPLAAIYIGPHLRVQSRRLKMFVFNEIHSWWQTSTIIERIEGLASRDNSRAPSTRRGLNKYSGRTEFSKPPAEDLFLVPISSP
jgi:hypothetical protein